MVVSWRLVCDGNWVVSGRSWEVYGKSERGHRVISVQTPCRHSLIFFFQFFYKSSSALYCLSSTQILQDHWATFCGVSHNVHFFVAGSSGIQTLVLAITMRTLYPYPMLTPHDKFFVFTTWRTHGNQQIYIQNLYIYYHLD